MSRAKKLLLVVILTNLVSSLAWSQAAFTSAAVKVELDSHGIVLQITQPTPLSKVLESICAATTTTCDIAPGAAESETIAPAQLNYAVVPGNATTQGRLVVAANPGGSEFPQSSNSEVSASISMPAQPNESMMGPASAMGTTTSPASGNTENVANVNVNDSPYPSSFNQAGVDSSGMTATPYASRNGNPILVPVANQTLTESPYSDSEGRPVKIYPTSQPLTELPYSDPQGRPLPTPAATSGQPVVPPYPLGPYNRH